MSYTQFVEALFHGGDDDGVGIGGLGDMTPEEFEHTVSTWETDAPALAAHVRALQGRHELDYNDQCDLAFGRLRRLVQKEPELFEQLPHLTAVDLGIDGLGLSGEQGAQVIQQIGAIEAEKRRHADSTEAAWGVIANASDWDAEGREEWLAAAVRWRDQNLGAVALEEWRHALERRDYQDKSEDLEHEAEGAREALQAEDASS